MHIFAGLRAARVLQADGATLAVAVGGIDGWDWATAGIVLVATVILARIARYALRRVLLTRIDSAVADLLSRLAGYVLLLFGFVYALEQLSVQIGPLLGALGVAGIAIAFALKDILENFVAGLLLQFRRPFSYGDEISSGDVDGTVQSIDGRSVTVVTPDGRTVYLPSSHVITQPIVNHFQQGRRRSTLEVGVDYSTDLEEAISVLTGAAQGQVGVLADPPAESLVMGFGESSVDIAVRFWHEPGVGDEWRTRSRVARAIHRDLDAAGIGIPFPHRRLLFDAAAGADIAEATGGPDVSA